MTPIGVATCVIACLLGAWSLQVFWLSLPCLWRCRILLHVLKWSEVVYRTAGIALPPSLNVQQIVADLEEHIRWHELNDVNHDGL